MPKLSSKDKIEKYFKMPFEMVIKELHLKQKISLNELSKRCEINRNSITSIAKKNGLKTRSVKEATRLTKNKGENHWAYGKTKENCKAFKKHSDRMKQKNPSYNLEMLTKSAVKRAETFRKNPWPQEVMFENILKEHKVEYIFQYPIKSFIIDFFIEDISLCIEIDSVWKWGKIRRSHAEKKDKILKSLGYNVLRIDKRLLKDKKNILDILKANNVIV